MKTAKIGVIFLASALSLAGIGISYAAWTDTIYIQGTVNTGSFGWHFSEYSGTWVYKVPVGVPGGDPEGNEIAVRHYTYQAGWNGPLMVNGWIPVAHARAYQGVDDHHAIVEFVNIFPCIVFEADVTIEYTGSVPGILNAIGFYDLQTYPENYWPEPGTDEELIDQYTTITVAVYDETGALVYDGVPYVGLQFHQGYTIHAVMTIHLPQDNTLMNLSGDFGVFAEIIQWNEYAPP
jgi:hypothetical protein